MTSGCFVVSCSCWREDGITRASSWDMWSPSPWANKWRKQCCYLSQCLLCGNSKGKLDTRHVTECSLNSGWPLCSCHWRLVKVSQLTSCARCQRPSAGSHPPETPAETHYYQPENTQHWNPASSTPAMLTDPQYYICKSTRKQTHSDKASSIGLALTERKITDWG